MAHYTIGFRLNVIRGDRVMVPGCEPASTVTSTRMEAEMRRAHLCKCAIVDLEDILEAIPGSYTEFIPNSGYMGSTKLLILPAVSQDCPCTVKPDYYAILRSLCREATEEEIEEICGCDSFSIGCEKDRDHGREDPEHRESLHREHHIRRDPERGGCLRHDHDHHDDDHESHGVLPLIPVRPNHGHRDNDS